MGCFPWTTVTAFAESIQRGHQFMTVLFRSHRNAQWIERMLLFMVVTQMKNVNGFPWLFRCCRAQINVWKHKALTWYRVRRRTITIYWHPIRLFFSSLFFIDIKSFPLRFICPYIFLFLFFWGWFFLIYCICSLNIFSFRIVNHITHYHSIQ